MPEIPPTKTSAGVIPEYGKNKKTVVCDTGANSRATDGLKLVEAISTAEHFVLVGIVYVLQALGIRKERLLLDNIPDESRIDSSKSNTFE